MKAQNLIFKSVVADAGFVGVEDRIPAVVLLSTFIPGAQAPPPNNMVKMSQS